MGELHRAPYRLTPVPCQRLLRWPHSSSVNRECTRPGPPKKDPKKARIDTVPSQVQSTGLRQPDRRPLPCTPKKGRENIRDADYPVHTHSCVRRRARWQRPQLRRRQRLQNQAMASGRSNPCQPARSCMLRPAVSRLAMPRSPSIEPMNAVMIRLNIKYHSQI